ncbi:MAG TPA: two-component regulator propeller domain-containing protein [Pseudomonadales bacterium]|nr:two-component regulator propeller domain-containing protein [Pseudomonadales bacterium]
MLVKLTQMYVSFCRALTAGLLLVFLPAIAMASTNSAWTVHAWQSSDGLPNNAITGIAQTDDGFLWLSNPSHLARFDGVNFRGIPVRNFVPSVDQEATALLRAHSGELWIGMNRGMVVCLNGDTPKIFTNDLPSQYVQRLAEDKDGAILVAFRGGNVCRIQDGQITHFTATNGLPEGYECFFAKDKSGTLWFGKGPQAGIFQDGNFKARVQLPTPVTGMASASSGGVWIVSGNDLFYCDDEGALHDCGKFFQAGSAQRTPVLEDAFHAVWIGTEAHGLFRYDGSGFENVPTSNNEILSLFQDRERNLWVGTDGGGLDRITPRAMELQDQDDGLTSEVIRSICQDSKGVIWAATKDGAVVCQSNGVWHAIIPPHSSAGDASCVAAAPDGALWIGTQSRMLHCLREGKLTTLKESDGLASRVIRCVLVDKTGAVWLAEEYPNTLQCYRDGKFYTYTLPPDMRVLRPLVEDEAGNIWVGSSKGILLRVTGDQVVDETPLMTTNRPLAIRSLFVTPDNALWIGFAGAGVGQLKDGHFKRIGTGSGLTDGYISEMVSDSHGWVWFGADSGIFKVRLDDLEKVADGKALRVDSVNYKDFPALQANFGNSPAALRSSDGRLWMPMLTALAVVEPDKILEDKTAANPVLEQILVDDVTTAAYGSISVDWPIVDLSKHGAELKLPPGRHRLEFDFAALSFTAPENIQFRYRLAGLDTHWIHVDGQHNAIYSQVAPGKYEFQVTACNSDGVWSPTIASVSLSIAPFYWQTWWFRIGVCLAVIGLVRYISVRRIRVKLQLLEKEAALDRERMRIAKDLHDDLGTQLTKMVLLSGLAQRDLASSEKTTEHLKKLSAAAQQVINSLDETVWAVNPRNNTLPNLINYIGYFAVEFMKTAEIHCTVDLPERPPNCAIPAAVRHNLFLAVKEALNNVVRHANAGTVKLRITATEQLLEITIEDDGCGFEKVPADNGADGLYNMRHRIEEIGGTFQLKSEPRLGTTIVFTSPCNGKNGKNGH